MLKNLIKIDKIQLIDNAGSWEQAIKIAAQPLLDSNDINESYIDKMISNVIEIGPYICLAPNFAMPHARPEDGVNNMGISLMLTKQDVLFPKEKTARLFITLAAKDSNSHLEALKELMEILTNDIDELLASTSKEEILAIINKY